MVQPPADRGVAPTRLWGGSLAWAILTVAVVVAGVLAVTVRPLAPDLGPLPDPARWFPRAVLERVAAYRGPVRIANVVGVVVDIAVPLLVVLTPPGRRLVARIVVGVGRQRPVLAATAVIVTVIAMSAVARLPLAVWAYTHARRFGLSTQTPAGWAGDWAIELAIFVVSSAVVAAAGYGLLSRWPRRWLLLVAPSALVAVAVATLAMPLVVEPLRFDVTELPAGPAREALTPVLSAADQPTTPVLVADASRRTTRQNAYVAGVAGTRRIVLYDTLLERPPSQVALIVAHELSHERNRDLARGIVAGAAGLWLLAVVVDLVLRWRVARGRQPHVADPHAAGVVVVVVVVAMVVTTPLASWASRRAEAAADLGALRLSGATAVHCAVQLGLVERNLSDPAPPTWERLWWWTHPPAVSRLELASRIDASRAAAAAECRREPGDSP
ncbi:MAG: M48 family metalloprotease [Actinobacteria bacterium]|nr:M48 family metalloprotease [Actinomycetota bacterium]